MANENILVVDDNVINTKLMSFLLDAAGYRVRTSADAEEALDVLRAWLPELIVMDIQIPGMDGLALTRVLRADPRTQSIVIVAVTAYAMRGDEERALEAGCDGYIVKPIDTRGFASLIAGYIERGVKGAV